MGEHVHRYKLENYTLDISKGICECGQVKYHANGAGKEIREEVERLNKKEGIMDTGINKDAGSSPSAERVATGPARGHARRKFLDDHRKEIMQDLANKDGKLVREKWNLSPASIRKLLKRWEKEDKELPRFKAPLEPVSPLPDNPYGLPPWQDSWTTETQVKWLEVFCEIKVNENKNKPAAAERRY